MARTRIQQRRLQEETLRRRKSEMVRNIKLFFIVSALLITVVATFILMNGAWTLINP